MTTVGEEAVLNVRTRHADDRAVQRDRDTDAEAASLSGLSEQQTLTHRRRGDRFLEVCNVTCRFCQVSNSRSHGEAGTV